MRKSGSLFGPNIWATWIFFDVSDFFVANSCDFAECVRCDMCYLGRGMRTIYPSSHAWKLVLILLALIVLFCGVYLHDNIIIVVIIYVRYVIAIVGLLRVCCCMYGVH